MELLEPLMAKVYKFTAVVENAITCATDIPNIVRDIPKGIASDLEEKIEWAIEMLTASRQQEIYIRFPFKLPIVSFGMRLACEISNTILLQEVTERRRTQRERSEKSKGTSSGTSLQAAQYRSIQNGCSHRSSLCKYC